MTPDPSALEALARPLVERVAREMYDREHRGLSNCYAWDDRWEDHQEVRRERYIKNAHAAIAIVVEACAEVADNHVATGYMSGREREYCHQHGDEIAEKIRALTDRKP